MSAALRWLGAAEEDRHVRAYLLGQWRDLSGTIYTLSRGRNEATINVLTVRPDGEQRFTLDLIRCYDGAAFWGKPSRQFACDLAEPSRVIWRRAGAVFRWTRIQ